MKIYPVVEGQGEVSAMPVLLRRLIHDHASCYGVEIGSPIRRKAYEFTREDAVKKAVLLAAMQTDCAGIIVVFDGEDICPKEWGPQIQAWCQQAARNVPCQVVIAYREYETWFLSSVESLRGQSGIARDAVAPDDPERKRDAKGEIDRLMPSGSSYSPTVHQASFSAVFDLRQAHQRNRSFRKLTKCVGQLLADMNQPLPEWPPTGW